MADLIDDRVNGALARPLDSDDLAAKLAWVLNKAPAEQLATAARRGVEEKHRPGVVAARYLELFNRVCG